MASIIPVVAVLLLLGGDIPDPDRNAHDMWALQLINRGSLVISEHGTFDDWKLYYPNTVPKPAELVIGFLRAPGGTIYQSGITLLTAMLVLAAARYAAGGGRTGAEAALFLGLNPVFIILCLRGNPAIPFLGGMFLLQSKASTTGALLASLARPEGFIYSGFLCLRHKNWKLLPMLAAAAAVWLVFHRITCGSFTWAADEVKFSVAAMAYPTPNAITFLPWAGLRSILILGAPAAAVLLNGFKRWQLRVPFALNFLLLGVSLAMGSLVLPRYIDQLFLLAIPFIFIETARITTGKKHTLLVIAMLVFPSLQWIGTVPEIKEYVILREVYSSFQMPEEGIVAANELLIPGLCLGSNIVDPSGRFVSVDKAAWAHASEADLTESGVTRVVIVPRGVYFPIHTEEWLEEITDIEVQYYRD